MQGKLSTCVLLVLTVLITLPAAWAGAASLAEPPDFSGTGGAPTNFALGFGSNTLTGTMGGSDRDIVHVSIPAGGALASLSVVSYVSSDATAFAAVQAGSTWSGDPNTGGPTLGWSHFGASSGDILDNMGASQGGFTPPLTGSDYTFWVQQTGASTNYSLNFQVVPEPAGVVILAVAGIPLFARRRRR